MIFATPEGKLVLLCFLDFLFATLMLMAACLVARVKMPSLTVALQITFTGYLVGTIVTVFVYLFAAVAVRIMNRQDPERMALILWFLLAVPVDLYVSAWLYKALLEDASFQRSLLVALIQFVGAVLFFVMVVFFLGLALAVLPR